jgi:hypothetical protein
VDAAAHLAGHLENGCHRARNDALGDQASDRTRTTGSAISPRILVRPLISAPLEAMRRRYMQAPPSTRRIFPVTQAASSDAR